MKLPLYFISDNHFFLENNTLEANRRNKLFNLFNYIKKTGGTLIIGGDFFDFWLQSRTGPPNYYNDILEELEQLYLNNITIHYVMGNHDYWDLGFFKKKFGANVYKTDFLLKIGEKKILVTHGDGVLKHDYMYRFMRKIIRSKLFIFFVRLIPISIMLISDLILGYSINLAVYISFMIMVCCGFFLQQNQNGLRIINITILGSLIFFIVTNLSVFLTSSLYPKSIIGLLECYTLAIPFFLNTIIGNIIYSLIMFYGFNAIKSKILIKTQ